MSAFIRSEFSSVCNQPGATIKLPMSVLQWLPPFAYWAPMITFGEERAPLVRAQEVDGIAGECGADS